MSEKKQMDEKREQEGLKQTDRFQIGLKQATEPN